jgi:hypothetical protein
MQVLIGLVIGISVVTLFMGVAFVRIYFIVRRDSEKENE